MNFKNKGNFELALNELKNDKNNAVAQVYEQANNQNKQGTLSDVVLTIKDVFATDDKPTQASSKILLNFQPHYNATSVQKLINAGAIKIAKVHSDELALGGTGTYSAFGLVKNQLDSERLSGGSSSGSVVTLTKNVGLALASDTGDSVRLPASYNGCVGYKPSYGAISRFGMFSYASSLDTVAYFAHNVNDIVVASQSLFGKDEKDFTSVEVKINDVNKIKPQKVLILDTTKLVIDQVANELKNLQKILQKSGISVDFKEPNEDIYNAIKPVYDIISYSEASANLANLNGIAFGQRQDGETWDEIMTNTRSKGFGSMIQRRMTLGSFFLHSENQKELFIKAQKARRVINNYITKLHEEYDLVIMAASANVAPYIDNSKNKKYGYMDYILTGANLVGNPSLSIPWIKVNNLPINLCLDAKKYEDEKLLSHALYIEELLGGKHEN